MHNKKIILIIIGPPGSGKGTQGVLLEQRLGFYHLESADLIEEKFKDMDPNDKELMAEKKRFDDGILTSPEFIVKLIEEKIKTLEDAGRDIVLSGSPRTLFEAEKEMPIFIDIYGKENVKVVHINIPPEESIRRNSHRRICEGNRHPIPDFPEFKDIKVCPEDGSRVVTRGSLDTPEVIKVRLKEYKERTEPVLDLVKDKFDIPVFFTDGMKPIEENYVDIKGYIDR